jgi:hypothetical protein
MNKKAEISMTGFIVALILIAMFAGIFGTFVSQMNAEYGKEGNNTFTKYEAYTAEINETTERIKASTNINQTTGLTDIIGGFFSAGFAALKTSVTSINLFDSMMDDAASDVEPFAYFKVYIIMIIIVIIFVGIIISALLKYRV